jgi:glycosyltransferase involved in cell wall biosynthesis
MSGMSDIPSVCALIPVFKDQTGIVKTLEAIARDHYPYDVVVVDDGSPEPIRCPDRAGIHPVTLLRMERNQGIEHALNRGLEHLLGKGYRYIARLDADDTPMEGRIARQAEYLDRNQDVGVVGTWAKCVDDDGRHLFTLRFPTGHSEILRKQRYVPAMLHPTVMIRADAIREVGLYSDRYKTAEDYDLFVRLGQKYRLANIPAVLTEYIVSNAGTTIARRRKNLISRLRIQRDYFSWADPHAYLGVARTILFMGIPFGVLIAVKRRLWQ